MASVSSLPVDFYRYIAETGLSTKAGTVRINHYMNLNMPETCRAPELFDALNTANPITDWDTEYSAFQAATEGMTYPGEEWRIMRKGQGFYKCYVKLWNWLWDNQEQLRDSSDARLSYIWMKYFEVPSDNPDENPIQHMMDRGYFGYECLGFVANYLRYAGILPYYEGTANGNWKKTFEIPVNDPKNISAVDCIEWANGTHVALVNAVRGVSGGTATVDICQSSSGGPRHDPNVALTLSPDKSPNDATAAVYELSGNVPVTGKVWIRKRRGLAVST